MDSFEKEFGSEYTEDFEDDDWTPQPDPSTFSHVNMSPADHERYLLDISNEYEQASLDYARLCSGVARADADYHYAFFSAMVDLSPSIKPAERRKAMASLQARKEYYKWRLLQERQRASSQYLQSLKMKIEIGRTISANMRNMA
jgi:hypothetical protein